LRISLFYSTIKQKSNSRNNEPISLSNINALEHNAFPTLGSSTISTGSIKGASKSYNLALKKANLLKKKIVNLKLKLNSVTKENLMVFK
jgi:hypothetical protein